jgi:hypothetical protein
MTDRSTVVGVRAVVVVVLGVVVLAVVCALLAHHACTHSPPPVEHPEPGTPRSDYCGVVDQGVPWLAALVAGLLTGSALLLVRRWGATAVAVVTVLLCLACLAVPIVAGSLESAYTI